MPAMGRWGFFGFPLSSPCLLCRLVASAPTGWHTRTVQKTVAMWQLTFFSPGWWLMITHSVWGTCLNFWSFTLGCSFWNSFDLGQLIPVQGDCLAPFPRSWHPDIASSCSGPSENSSADTSGISHWLHISGSAPEEPYFHCSIIGNSQDLEVA